MQMLHHTGTLTMETARLVLRRAKITDVKPMFDNWASDPEVTKFLTWPPHTNVEVTETIIKNWMAHYKDPDYYQWVIALKDEPDNPIGSINADCDDATESATIGYCIGKRWWRQGIMTEALQAVMDLLFETVGMNRVAATHDKNNPNSGKVMQKCGMQYEGTLRQAGRNNQGICDSCCYALLAQDRV